jgi:hypothetical protein
MTQMDKRTVTEMACERRLATAVSMPETSGFEVPSQKESHNAEGVAAFSSSEVQPWEQRHSSWTEWEL